MYTRMIICSWAFYIFSVKPFETKHALGVWINPNVHRNVSALWICYILSQKYINIIYNHGSDQKKLPGDVVDWRCTYEYMETIGYSFNYDKHVSLDLSVYSLLRKNPKPIIEISLWKFDFMIQHQKLFTEWFILIRNTGNITFVGNFTYCLQPVNGSLGSLAHH